MANDQVYWRVFWDELWRREKICTPWDELCQVQYKALKAVLPSVTSLLILEAGSGTGRVSLRLASEGANVVLTDFSKKALSISKSLAEREGISAILIVSSIFALPFRDGVFDVVWNSGVLEHYDESWQRQALSEMMRVCRVGGYVITMVPYYHAIFYRFAKRYLELKRKWKFGYEKPMKTLAHLVPFNGQLVCEFDEGKEIHLRWLHFFDFLPRFFRRPEAYPGFYRRLLKNVRGYLLISVMRKVSP